MANTELKTKKNEASVEQFLEAVKDDAKREDSYAILKMLEKITKKKPKMWGASIVGFDEYHYVGASGREGDWFITGFSPRKANITIYLSAGVNRYPELLKKLGKHKTGVGCLYINKLEDIDKKILEELIKQGVAQCRASQKK